MSRGLAPRWAIYSLNYLSSSQFVLRMTESCAVALGNENSSRRCDLPGKILSREVMEYLEVA